MPQDELLQRLDRRIAEVERRLGTHTEVWEGIRIDMRQREERWVRVYREETGKTRASNEKLWAEVRDLREESIAQRKALLALIDRLPPPGPPTA